jgi:hypothetical protein
MEIRLVRLVDGEQFFCQVKEDTPNKIIVIKPVVLIEVQDEKTKEIKFAFAPWQPAGMINEDTIPFNPSAIAFIAHTSGGLENAYRQRFGDGLILPPSEKKLVV